MLDPSDVGWPDRLSFYFALAFGGAISAITVWPPKTRWAAVGNLFVGTLLSVTTAPALMAVIFAYWPSLVSSEVAAEAVRGALYFWLGALGLKLIPVGLSAIKLLKSIRVGGAPE